MNEQEAHPLLALIRLCEERQPGFIERLLDPSKLKEEIDEILSKPMLDPEDVQRKNFLQRGTQE